jgi:hypothetical protein
MDKKLKIIIYGLIAFIIICLICSLAAIFIVRDENARCKNRAEKCLSIYDEKDYPVINQNPIPNGGKYFNQYYKSDYYYGLRDFFYAASYKSYLPCGYTNDVVSYNAIRNVLLVGARVIHLDIFYDGIDPFGDDAKIIVGNVINGKLSYSRCKNIKKDEHYLEFMSCLEIIRDGGWKKTNTPLLLYLNMEFLPNEKLEYQIFSQLKEVLSKRFMHSVFGFQNKNIGEIPVNMAMGKIIILTNRKPLDGPLNEITNGVMSDDSSNIILYKLTKNEIEFGGIKTKFAKKEDVLKICMENMVAVMKDSIPNDKNEYKPKIDTDNYDASSHFELGISITFMSFQNNPKEYLKKFENGGMILKPAELIYIPKPKPIVQKRDTRFDYETTNVSGMNGFYNFDF